MAEKFPSLPRDKQAVVAINVRRWTVAGRERAVVVTTERRRIVIFVSRDDGSWASFVRAHHALTRMPTTPEGSSRLNWSGRVGLATDEKTLAVVYKRRLGDDREAGLWVERLNWDSDRGELAPPVADRPLRVPLADLGADHTGFSLWADQVDGRLLVLTQTVRAGAHNLALLTSEPPALEELSEDVASWRITTLESGGFDFDARRAGSTLHVIHRRRGAYVTVPRKQMPSPDAALLLEEVPSGLEIPPLAAMMLPLVLLTVDVAALVVTGVDETLPAAEHPQLLHVDPVFIVADRLLVGELRTFEEVVDEVIMPRIRWRQTQTEQVLICRFQDEWMAEQLRFIARDVQPRHFVPVRGVQLLIGRQDETFELATLMPQDPAALLHFADERKHQVLVLAHEDPSLAALVATTFALSRVETEIGPRFVVSNGGFAVLDINHVQLGTPIAGMPFRPENGQFEPLGAPGPFSHQDGFLVSGPPSLRNTLGGALAAAAERPTELYAYVDMGDGGLRVFHDSNVDAPPPIVTFRDKALTPEMVPGPGGGERTWIEVSASDFAPTGLTSWRAPYADFVRGFEGESGEIPVFVLYLFLLAGGLPLLRAYLEPASLQSSLQALLDILPFPAALAGTIDEPPFATDEVLLDAAGANAIQQFIASTSGTSGRFGGDNMQPFGVAFWHRPAIVFAGDPIAFEGEADPAAGVTFEWSFADDGTTATGPATSHVFATAGATVVTLTATTTAGEVATVSRTIPVAPTMWDTLWAPFDGVVASGAFTLGNFELTLFQYRLAYVVDGAGSRGSVTLRWLDGAETFFRFHRGPGLAQGEVEHVATIGFQTSAVSLQGILGTLVRVERVDGAYRYGRRFTPCVLTSDQRHEDPLRRRGFPHPVETIQRLAQDDGNRFAAPVPSALAMKPLSPSGLTLERVGVTASLTDAAKSASYLVAALLSLGVGGVVAAALLPILLAIGLGGLIVAGAMGLTALLGLLISLGLVWLLVEVVAPPALAFIAQGFLERDLRDGISAMRERLDAQGLLTYTGEGLAEALAVHVIRRARALGHEVADANLNGRDRLRSPFFETVFVTEGLCRVLIRVPTQGAPEDGPNS